MAKQHSAKKLKQFENELLDLVIAHCGNRQDLKRLFFDLLSPKEYAEILIRWQIVKELSQGTSQREIADTLRVSISKITRGSRVLADGGALAMFLEKDNAEVT